MTLFLVLLTIILPVVAAFALTYALAQLALFAFNSLSVDKSEHLLDGDGDDWIDD